MLNFGGHCTLQFVTNGSMRRQSSSCDSEIAATRWVEKIIREIELYPVFRNTSKGPRRSIGNPGPIQDIKQQAQIDLKIAGPSQEEGRSSISFDETSVVALAKRKRGRPKKMSTPAILSLGEEEGIVTRSQMGNPGLLGKIGEVQSKAPITKSPIKQVTPQPSLMLNRK